MAMSEIPLGNELSICALIALIWLMGKIMQLLRCSPLLGYIVAGIFVGPSLGGFFPFSEAFSVLGNLGVMLFVIEGGLALEFSQVRGVGLRAFGAAFMGVIMPILFIVAYLGGLFEVPLSAALAAGAALAPTSMGFSAQLLDELGELKSDFGALVTVTAIFDDVIAIVVLAEIQAIAALNNGETLSGNRSWDLAAPIVASALSILLGLAFSSHYGIPPLVSFAREKLPRGRVREQATLGMLLILSSAYAFVCGGIGSSALLGCFLSGLTFSSVNGVHKFWDEQLGRFVQWGLRFFFACTIAFSIPPLTEPGGMFSSGTVVGRGVVLAFLGLLGKMFVGCFATPLGDFLAAAKFGLAMNGRGEFSFLIATQAHVSGLLSKDVYSSVVLGIVLVSLVTPFGFRGIVMLEKAYSQKGAGEEEAVTYDSSERDDTEEVEEVEMVPKKRYSPHPPSPKVYAPEADDGDTSDEDDIVDEDDLPPEDVVDRQQLGSTMRPTGASSSVPSALYESETGLGRSLNKNQRVASAPARQINVVIDQMDQELHSRTTNRNSFIPRSTSVRNESVESIYHLESEKGEFDEAEKETVAPIQVDTGDSRDDQAIQIDLVDSEAGPPVSPSKLPTMT